MKRLFEMRWKIAVFRWIAPWIARLSSPCPDIVRLASEACDRPLTWRDRGRMRLHFLICDWCRRYTRQVDEIHRLAPLLASKAPQLHRRKLTPEVRQRLKDRLRSGSAS